LIAQRTGLDASPLDLATSFYFADAKQIGSIQNPILLEYVTSHPEYETRITIDRIDAALNPMNGRAEHLHPFFHQLEGGTETTTLLLANVRGICADHQLPSNEGLNRYESLIWEAKQKALNGAGFVIPEIENVIPSFRDGTADLFNSSWLTFIHERCSPVAHPMLAPVEKSLAEDSKTFYKKLKAGKLSNQERQKLFAVLDYALDHGRIAAIGFDLNTILQPAAQAQDNSDHSSTIIGRRWNKGNCEYLLRDPAGYECKEYQSSLQPRCHEHHLWLTDSELIQSFYSLVYLR
jgi:hypothetical protein